MSNSSDLFATRISCGIIVQFYRFTRSSCYLLPFVCFGVPTVASRALVSHEFKFAWLHKRKLGWLFALRWLGRSRISDLAGFGRLVRKCSVCLGNRGMRQLAWQFAC